VIDPHRSRLTSEQATPRSAISAMNPLHVIAHQKKLMSAVGLRRMDGQLGGRQREDQPAVPGIHGRVGQHIPEERAIGVGVGAVEDDMCAPNHELSLVTPERP
jgi:hypothetical protein